MTKAALLGNKVPNRTLLFVKTPSKICVNVLQCGNTSNMQYFMVNSQGTLNLNENYKKKSNGRKEKSYAFSFFHFILLFYINTLCLYPLETTRKGSSNIKFLILARS